ncbi:uncharacterized protein LOC129911203 [Episyrphus balteatus]|uniref:uncharacterized protein LOC129911203 n=1 Tax=Episyrphus balteatus TaxID=286459 RepID=UPI0024869DCC|nr:uncharacterized protein LOC129911203 [Episyrphus balteatus]
MDNLTAENQMRENQIYEDLLEEILSSSNNSPKGPPIENPNMLIEFDSNSNDLNESNVNIFPEAPTRRNSTHEDELLNVEQAVTIENNLSETARKRPRNEKNWKQNEAKRLRQEGKAYTSSSKKLIPAKQIRLTCDCRKKCDYQCWMIQEEDRKEIFKSYYKLDAQGKRIFLSNFTERDVSRFRRRERKNLNNSKKQFSFRYYFNVRENRFRVCKKYFLATLDISQKPIYNVHSRVNAVSGVPVSSKQGKHVKKVISPETKDAVRKHIARFPTVESHYCRCDSKKKYLEGSLNVSAMWKLFLEEASNTEERNVKISMYRNIFETDFNISFFKPKKDRCDLCEEFKITSSSNNIPESLKQKHESHQQQKIKSREIRQQDRTLSTPVICFDLQNVLSCPKAEVSSFFYHSKLNTYNLTAHLSTNNMVQNLNQFLINYV